MAQMLIYNKPKQYTKTLLISTLPHTKPFFLPQHEILTLLNLELSAPFCSPRFIVTTLVKP